MQNIQDLTKTLSSLLSQEAAISLAILYGSFTKGSAHETSDVDLALASTAFLSADEKVRLADLLSRAVGREIDLLDLRAVTGTIRHEAMSNGIVLVNKDPELYAKIMKDMLYYEADLAPQIQQLIDQRLKRFIDG